MIDAGYYIFLYCCAIGDFFRVSASCLFVGFGFWTAFVSRFSTISISRYREYITSLIFTNSRKLVFPSYFLGVAPFSVDAMPLSHYVGSFGLRSAADVDLALAKYKQNEYETVS